MVKKLTIIKALEPFLVKPKEALHLADISRSLKEPHPTVRQWLNALEKKGMLKKSFKGRLTLYSLNFDSPLLMDYLVIAEKSKLVEKCEHSLVLKEVSSFISLDLSENSKALIFGSAAESFNSAGDIDLLITGNADLKELKKLSEKLGKELHIIPVQSLSKVSSALKTEIIKKHLIIKGSEDIARWLFW